MTVLGVVGSPRKDGNTDELVQSVLDGVTSVGMNTNKVYLVEEGHRSREFFQIFLA